LLIRDELFVLRCGILGAALAIDQGLFAAREILGQATDRSLALGQGRVAFCQQLFERRRFLAVLPGLTLGGHDDVVRLLLGLEQQLFFLVVRIALGVLGDAEGLCFGTTDGLGGDAFAV